MEFVGSLTHAVLLIELCIYYYVCMYIPRVHMLYTFMIYTYNPDTECMEFNPYIIQYIHEAVALLRWHTQLRNMI